MARDRQTQARESLERHVAQVHPRELGWWPGLLGQSVAERDDLDVRGRQTILEVLPTARESQHLDDGEEQQADHREDRQVAQLWIHVRLPGTIGQDCAGHATGIVTIAPGVKAHRLRAQLTPMTTFPRARIVSR
jgi:hypothetical protein